MKTWWVGNLILFLVVVPAVLTLIKPDTHRHSRDPDPCPEHPRQRGDADREAR